MNLIPIAIAVVGAVGLVAACILSFASKVLFVPVDERFPKLRAALPGANCGGCGFAGCDDYANALIENPDLAVTKCPVGGEGCANQLAEILGKVAEAGPKQVAVVMCNGTKDAVKPLLTYNDIKTCKAAKNLFGGMNACPYGCLGLGDCEAACDFDAIHIKDGLATVDLKKCVACGACATACPNGLIRISPEKNVVIVKCNNHDKGAAARKQCDNACIGCMKCTKVCKFEAIKVENNCAFIDPEKCKNCGLCAKECPTGAIHNYKPKKAAKPKMTPEQIEAAKKAAAAKKAKAAEAAGDAAEAAPAEKPAKPKKTPEEIEALKKAAAEKKAAKAAAEKAAAEAPAEAAAEAAPAEEKPAE